ncbi:MAG TPA: hypothetical protein VN328_13095 [Thermodesulfovibrionales bacterium]|nr:hypothetical protein [Thermodesulfovibrionales bacterium]
MNLPERKLILGLVIINLLFFSGTAQADLFMNVSGRVIESGTGVGLQNANTF